MVRLYEALNGSFTPAESLTIADVAALPPGARAEWENETGYRIVRGQPVVWCLRKADSRRVHDGGEA